MQFYRRELPKKCVDFSSADGKEIFRESLNQGYMECYFRLAAQFRTQDDPAFCGLSTLVMILNALEIDPKRVWKGPWRWYHEDMLDCCIPLEVIRKKGITFTQFSCIAECNGLEVIRECQVDDKASKETFKSILLETTSGDYQVLVVSYSRKTLNQTGDGHFAAIGGYNSDKDLVLLLDTARFKYPPHWVEFNQLWEAMKMLDKETNLPRGYLVLKRADRGSNFSFRLDDRLYGALMTLSFDDEERSINLVLAWNMWLKWLDKSCSSKSDNEVIASAVKTLLDGIALNNNELFFLRMQAMCHDVDDERSELFKSMRDSDFGSNITNKVKELSTKELPKTEISEDCCKLSYFERMEVLIMIFMLSFPYAHAEGSWGHALNKLCQSAKRVMVRKVTHEIKNLNDIFDSLIRFGQRSTTEASSLERSLTTFSVIDI